MDNVIDQSSLVKRNEMILNNMGLAINITKSFYKSKPSTSDDFDDLLSIAVLGLISAVDTFDESKEIHFATYASICIQNSLRMYFRKCNRYNYFIPYSLQDIVFYDNDGYEVTREEFLPSKDNVEDKYIEDNYCSYSVNFILNKLHSIKKVAFLYYLSGINQHEIASILGYSQSYISRLIRSTRSTLKNLKHYNFTNGTDTYFFQILDTNYYSCKIFTPDIENCMKSTRVCNALSTLHYYDFKHRSNYYELIFSRNSDYFLLLASIIHELELN